MGKNELHYQMPMVTCFSRLIYANYFGTDGNYIVCYFNSFIFHGEDQYLGALNKTKLKKNVFFPKALKLTFVSLLLGCWWRSRQKTLGNSLFHFYKEQFSIGCHKTKAITWTNHNWKQLHVTNVKHGKMHTCKSWLVLFWFSLVGKAAHILLANHKAKQCKTKVNTIYFWCSIENRSNASL